MPYRRNIERKTAAFLLIILIWLTGSLGICKAADNALDTVEHKLLIVNSSDNPFFRRSIERIKKQLPENTNIVTLLSKEVDQYRKQLENASLIITMGAQAMRAVRRINPSPPLLHAYLTRFQYLTDSPAKGSHSLLLDQPLERYLRFDRLLTGARHIGLLVESSTEFPPSRLESLTTNQGLQVQQKVLEPGHGNPVAAVRQLLQQNDNLLALPAPDIYNKRTLKGILLAAYRLRKPVISYSRAHVRAGALGALYATPEQIGDQIAELALDWIRGEPPDRSYSLARHFAIEINHQVASALNIELPEMSALQQAIDTAPPE